MTASTVQLALGVQLRDEATLENFYFPDSLGALRGLLESQPETGGEAAILLHGVTESGRTHLLQAACQRLHSGDALYLPLEELATLPAEEVLASTEQLRLLCLDNIDAVAGDSAWEEALFHLYNRSRESGCRLLISAAAAPRQLPLGLADLASRLSAALVLQLPTPDDDARLAILSYRAKRRGLKLGGEVAAFILHRASRSLGDLMAILEQLDRDSLVHKRPLSIPFVKDCMGW